MEKREDGVVLLHVSRDGAGSSSHGGRATSVPSGWHWGIPIRTAVDAE